ncbi:hypothetical protein ZIOFF_058195 [Zingiber officinale]|uniref:Retrotransposon gag domain-containing protein n=1 Tax=Zingiber officinale TaxID=94328 RepID=A0A8J5KCX5_ZINOF|nr:hypothetical protein ZIOFF_058195 [Zingiber officinale]
MQQVFDPSFYSLESVYVIGMPPRLIYQRCRADGHDGGEQRHTSNAHRGRQEDVYVQFRRMDPKDFASTTDPFVAEGWIRSLEVIFRYMDMTDTDRVRCVIYLLKDDASLWWEGAEKGVNQNTLTWEEFKRIFYEKYFTVDVRSSLQREFMSLRQGDLFVAEFVKKFDRGCRISIAGVATYAFLDSGATHSFISEVVIERLGILPEDKGIGFRVTGPSGEQMLSTRIAKDMELILQEHVVQADLIVLPMPKFDIILGMDWLSQNGASIDFRWRGDEEEKKREKRKEGSWRKKRKGEREVSAGRKERGREKSRQEKRKREGELLASTLEGRTRPKRRPTAAPRRHLRQQQASEQCTS